MNIGRNDPCVCGKKKPDGSPVKYKKCCMEKNIRQETLRKKLRGFSRKDLISEPYTVCPKCNQKTFGVGMMTGGYRYTKECTNCWYIQNFSLPTIKKKIIYLDQFFISNITKVLDPEARSHQKTSKEPFWLEAYKKLDTLAKMNLAIYPDSSFHADESLLSGDPTYESIKEVYEHLSNGCTFYDYNTITRFQIQQHLRNYLDNKSENKFILEAKNVIHGNLHEWLGRMRIGVNMPPYEGRLEDLKRERANNYENVKKVFERWQTENDKDFMYWVHEEANAFGEVTIKVHLEYLKRKIELQEKYAQMYLKGQKPEINIEDLFPPNSSQIINDIIGELEARGLESRDTSVKMHEYLRSKHMIDIPIIHVSSLLFAGIARKAGLGGQKEPPNKGTVTDVNAISSLLPYCDAIFIDNPMGSLLNEQPIKKEIEKYSTKIFSLNTKDEFLNYLDEIKNSATEEHKEIIKDAYGETWTEPYLSLLIQKKQRDEDEPLLEEENFT